MKPSDLKIIVQEKYGKIASPEPRATGSCCSSPDCCSPEGYSTFNESYDHLEGYVQDADLSLGCGIPVEFAGILPGHHVLDLGCGAGNDCFVARSLVGKDGSVTGLDFTRPMLEKAEENRKRLGYTNVTFVEGDIESMPLGDERFDVVISNCVLNLVPDKHKAFREINRVLKPGGHFCISDVVIRGELPEKIRSNAELYVGCVAGASPLEEYLRIIRETGFTDVRIHKEKEIRLPDHIIVSSPEAENAGIFSITISASKT